MIVENDFLLSRKKVFKSFKYIISIKDDRDDDEFDQVIGEIRRFKKH